MPDVGQPQGAPDLIAVQRSYRDRPGQSGHMNKAYGRMRKVRLHKQAFILIPHRLRQRTDPVAGRRQKSNPVSLPLRPDGGVQRRLFGMRHFRAVRYAFINGLGQFRRQPAFIMI